MTAKRRLAKVEATLDPLDIVLHVIAEGQEFASLDAYVRSIAEQPIGAAPLTRIIEQTDAAVRAAMNGKPRKEVEAAVRTAVGDAFFRFVMFLHINVAAHDVADRHGLISATLFFWMGCLLGGPRESDLEPEVWAAHQEEQRRGSSKNGSPSASRRSPTMLGSRRSSDSARCRGRLRSWSGVFACYPRATTIDDRPI